MFVHCALTCFISSGLRCFAMTRCSKCLMVVNLRSHILMYHQGTSQKFGQICRQHEWGTRYPTYLWAHDWRQALSHFPRPYLFYVKKDFRIKFKLVRGGKEMNGLKSSWNFFLLFVTIIYGIYMHNYSRSRK